MNDKEAQDGVAETTTAWIEAELTTAVAARDALARELAQRQESRAYTDGILRKINDDLAEALTQARTRLSAAKERTKELYDIVTDRNRKLTQAREELTAAEAERDKARQEAQAQSDLSGAEMGEALRTEVRKRCEAEEYVNDCRLVLTRVREALDKHQVEGKYDASITMRIEWLAERAAAPQAAIVEAAEALAKRLSPVTSLYGKELTALQEALEYKSEAAAKLLERIATLDAAEAALQHEQALRQVAETGERAARKMLARAIVEEADANLAAHVHSKAADELAQTALTEQALRQEAERCYAKLRKECQCAEALVAQLVNEETAGLLGRLASHAHFHDNDAGAARALAARIREALEVNDEG